MNAKNEKYPDINQNNNRGELIARADRYFFCKTLGILLILSQKYTVLQK